MKAPWRVVALLVLSAAVGACGIFGTASDLDGTEWALTSLNGSPPLAGVEITVSFEGQEITGSAGCNTYFGEYRREGTDGLVVTDLANTEIGCLEPPGIMEQEAEYLSVLRSATSFRVDDGELRIAGAGGALLIFARQE